MTQDLNQMRDRIMKDIAAASTIGALEVCRVRTLSKEGTVTALLYEFMRMPYEERIVQGPLINSLREAVANSIAERRATLELSEFFRKAITASGDRRDDGEGAQ